jgi:hypothetical protein
MREISKAMARYLHNSGRTVYRLYEDGTEAQISNLLEIDEHVRNGGIFGEE